MYTQNLFEHELSELLESCFRNGLSVIDALRGLGSAADGLKVPTRFYGSAKKTLLGFEFHEPGYWYGEPYSPFKPKGLLIWGATPGMVLSQALVGSDLQVVVSHVPIPAQWFATGESYEQIVARVAADEDRPEWCDWNTVAIGQKVRLELRTPLDESSLSRSVVRPPAVSMVMWGISLQPM